MRFLLGRPGGFQRRLSILNPVAALRVADTVARYETSLFPAATSPISLSTTQQSSSGRALVPQHGLGELPAFRSLQRATSRYALIADISRFYESVYTHTIAWALHTKAWAKNNRKASSVGNDLDRAIQFGQDGQTSGIPIGPDTSLLVGEIIAAAVDEIVLRSRPGARAFRHVDDYEFACNSLSDVEDLRSTLTDALAEFELGPNESKFRTVELPAPSQEVWVPPLTQRRRLFRGSAPSEPGDLADYFDLAFRLARDHPTASVLNYALGSLRGFVPRPANWRIYQAHLSQTMAAEPSTSPFVLEALVNGMASGLSADLSIWAPAVHTVVESNDARRNHSEWSDACHL